jgi:hypothetical protein
MASPPAPEMKRTLTWLLAGYAAVQIAFAWRAWMMGRSAATALSEAFFWPATLLGIKQPTIKT